MLPNLPNFEELQEPETLVWSQISKVRATDTTFGTIYAGKKSKLFKTAISQNYTLMKENSKQNRCHCFLSGNTYRKSEVCWYITHTIWGKRWILGLDSTYFDIAWYHSDNFDLLITNFPNVWAFLLENIVVVHWKKFSNQINKMKKKTEIPQRYDTKIINQLICTKLPVHLQKIPVSYCMHSYFKLLDRIGLVFW